MTNAPTPAGEVERKDRARKWLCDRWSMEHPNEGHVKQLADYEVHLDAQPSAGAEDEREAYLRGSLDVVLRAVLDMARVGIEVAKQGDGYHTEDRDRARIDFIREVCERWKATPVQPDSGGAVEADLSLTRSFLSDYAPRDVYAAWRRIETLAALSPVAAEGGEKDKLRIAVEALEQTKGRIQTWPIDDHETCMCGSPVSGHGMGDGHSPVSQGDHAVSMLVEEIDQALSALRTVPTGGGEGA